MTKESLLHKLKCALYVICHAFAKFGDLESGDENPGIYDAATSAGSATPAGPRAGQSLRWTFPFFWIALVFVSFVCRYGSVCSYAPLVTDSGFSPELETKPLLISSNNCDEHSLGHNVEGYGLETHDETYDPDLLVNKEQSEPFDKSLNDKPK